MLNNMTSSTTFKSDHTITHTMSVRKDDVIVISRSNKEEEEEEEEEEE
jgi:hypothetical protein